jgi:hypothetical protein
VLDHREVSSLGVGQVPCVEPLDAGNGSEVHASREPLSGQSVDRVIGSCVRLATMRDVLLLLARRGEA